VDIESVKKTSRIDALKKISFCLTATIFIVTLSLVFSIPDLFGATYYVDYVSGSDSNNGTSPSSPFKHCPGDSNATGNAATVYNNLGAGDTIYFKKGVTYYGQVTAGKSGSEPDYGSNANVTAGGIFTSSGQNFQTTVQAGDIVYIYHNSTTGAWINSVGFWPVSSVDSNTQLTLSGFTKSAYSGGDMTYRIFRPITYTSTASWGSGPAIIDGQNSRTYAFQFDTSSYIRFSGFTIQNIYGSCGDYVTACIRKINLTPQNNGVIIDNNTMSGWRAWHLWSHYSIIYNNTFTTTVDGPFNATYGNYMLVENNTMSGGEGATHRAGGNYQVIRGNSLINCYSGGNPCGFHSDGILIAGGTQSWLIGNYFYDCSLQAIYLTYDTDSQSHTDNFRIINNVIIGPNPTSLANDHAIHGLAAPNTIIYNNTIFSPSTSSGWLKAIWFGSGNIGGAAGTVHSTNVTIKNNLVYILSPSSWAQIGTNSAGSTGLTCDYNVVYIPNRANGAVFASAGTGYTLSQWRALGGHDHDTTSQPSLVDVVGTAYNQLDLHLQSGDTVARDHGTTGLLYYDRDNVSRPQGSGWDIGAYEYSGGAIDEQPAPPQNFRVLPR
jgi:hypothetical protein